MMKLLTISALTNSALAEAWHRGAPVNACQCSEWFDISRDKNIFDFTFGDYKYLNNYRATRSSEIYARAWDESVIANGLLFHVRIDQDLRQFSVDALRKLIGDEVSAVLYNLAAVRMAG